MTDTGNNRMVKKNKQTNKETLNIKHLRSACLEIFFSLFRPWCEVEIYVSSEFGTPHPSFSAPFLPKIPGSFPWDSPTISAPDTESIDLSSIFGQCHRVAYLGKTLYTHSWISPGRSVLSIRDRLLSIAGAEKQGFWLCHNKIYLIPPLRLSSILTPSPPLIGSWKKPWLSSSLSPPPPQRDPLQTPPTML